MEPRAQGNWVLGALFAHSLYFWVGTFVLLMERTPRKSEAQRLRGAPPTAQLHGEDRQEGMPGKRWLKCKRKTGRVN